MGLFKIQKLTHVNLMLHFYTPLAPIPFSSVSHFYTPWKRQKPKSFLIFSRGIEMEQWAKMDYIIKLTQ